MMNLKINNLTYIKFLSFITIFAFIQFNSINLYFGKPFNYNNDYIKIEYLTLNTANYYYKTDINTEYDISKRKIFIEDFINILYISESINSFFKDKITTHFNFYLKNYLLSSLIPRAPPFTFNF